MGATDPNAKGKGKGKKGKGKGKGDGKQPDSNDPSKSKGKGCFNCGDVNHWANECPKEKLPKGPPGGKGKGTSKGKDGKGKGGDNSSPCFYYVIGLCRFQKEHHKCGRPGL